MVRGARGVLPGYIPPNSTVFVCLDSLGHHEFDGEFFTTRPLTTGTRADPPAELVKVPGKYHYASEWGPKSVQAWNGRQMHQIRMIWFNTRS